MNEIYSYTADDDEFYAANQSLYAHVPGRSFRLFWVEEPITHACIYNHELQLELSPTLLVRIPLCIPCHTSKEIEYPIISFSICTTSLSEGCAGRYPLCDNS